MATTRSNMADKNDIKELHARIDSLVKAMYESNLTTNNNINQVTIQVAKMIATIEAMPKARTRPCEYFQDHKEWHAKEDDKAERKSLTWYAAWLSFIGVVILALTKIEPMIHIK
jgi:hypothetical protein